MKLAKHLVEKPWGRTDIPEAFGELGGQRVGEIWFEHDGPEPLPLLVKWLFTSEKLSIQVHPDNAQAAERGMESGKEECWYIVDAEPGAVLGIGTIRPLDSDELRAASLSGEIEQLMDWKPVKAGEYFYIPAGTVHAIGAGITLVEVQQYADITYRLYDYGRPRELHLDDGVAVSIPQPYADQRSGHAGNSRSLVDGPLFRLWLVTDAASLVALPDDGDRWVVPVSGGAKVGAEMASVGDCLLVPSGEAITLEEGGRLLLAMV
ncbi:MAG: class I mannose-6-phosphate isomerase [Sphingorhabdus sp.]